VEPVKNERRTEREREERKEMTDSFVDVLWWLYLARDVMEVFLFVSCGNGGRLM